MAERPGDQSCNILIQAPNWLGDVVMTTPLLAWLDRRRELPGGRRLRIRLGIRRAWSALFRDDPRVDGLVIHERRGRHRGPWGIVRQARLLREEGLEAILLAPPSFHAALVAFLAGIPRRIGHRGDGRSFLLTEALARSPRGTRPYPIELLDLGRVLLETDEQLSDPPGPALPGTEAWKPAPAGPGFPLVAVAPGTTYGEAKTWPAARVREFLDLATRWARVILLGDGQARAFAAGLRSDSGLCWADDLGADAQVIDLCGRTDLPGAVRVLKACRGFVGNDSGLMHVAAALGIPTVGVFGSSNPDWTAPGGPWARPVAAQGYACRPCYRKTCNQPRFCLEDVSAGKVHGALEDLMLMASGEGGRR